MGRSVYFFLGFVIVGSGYSLFSISHGAWGMSQVHCVVGFPSFCTLTLSHLCAGGSAEALRAGARGQTDGRVWTHRGGSG